ncbi:MAG: S8 family serine peptidase [Chloroflexi bacterium]|nr:S8 family serine peptidase [Chloroflexota bacterium]
MWWTTPSLLIALLVATLSFVPAVAAGPPPGRGPATHIVVFNEGVDADAASLDLVGRHGLTREFVYTRALRGASFIIPPGRLADVQSDPRVAFIERNQVVQAYPQVVPTGISRIEADVNTTANVDGLDDRVDVDIAIIDTGIDLDHPDLNVFRNTNCARGGPFGGNCKSGGSEGDDGNGHGTHVAGTTAALDNGIGVVGVAPGARLWAVRVLDNNGSGWMSWIIGGIDYVTKNADEIDVANMSLGCECESPAMDAAIASSVAAGVVYAVAAGNDNMDAAAFSPANHPDVITVSAIADFDGEGGAKAATTCRNDAGTDDTFATFSNYGSLIEIAAPGVCILSTWNDGGYYTISGTSMASPHVAGGAALYVVENVGKTPAQVRDGLIAAGTPQSDPDGFTGDTDGFPEPLLNVAGAAPEPQVLTADAGLDETFSDGDGDGVETVTLDGSGSTDPDGTIDTYEWDIDGDGTTDLMGLNPSADFDVLGSPHTVTLTVTDNDGNTDTDDVVITVNANQSPTADAGPDQTVVDSDSSGSEDVTLDGHGSTDPDGTIASYLWMEDTTVLGTTARITVGFALGSHTVTLTVTDNVGATSSDSVVVTVTEPSPIATSVSVDSITYVTEGGKNSDKHLFITVALLDNFDQAVGGASVSIDLFRDGSFIASGTAPSGADGTLTFSLKNARSGVYTTTVTDVTADSLTWDGATPANSFSK